MSRYVKVGAGSGERCREQEGREVLGSARWNCAARRERLVNVAAVGMIGMGWDDGAQALPPSLADPEHVSFLTAAVGPHRPSSRP